MEAGLPFRFRYHAHPLMRALLGYVLGYLLADACLKEQLPVGWLFLWMAPCLLFFKWKLGFRLPVLLLSWCSAGFGHYSLALPPHIAYQDAIQTACIVLESNIKPSSKGWKVRIRYRGQIWLAYGKGDYPPSSAPGQRWVAVLRQLPPPHAALPGSFDFRRWLIRQGLVGCLKIIQFRPMPNDFASFRWKAFWGGFRNSFRTFLLQNLRDNHTVHWVEALLLGQDDDLSESVQISFRNTGTLHVLAISGLHIGLLYWVMNRLLSLLGWGEKMKSPFLLLFLWSFSFLTDLPESISRASIMYSLSMLARLKSRTMEGSHALCGSALLILWLKPASLWSAGFLLSHAAVAGLLLIHPQFEPWMEHQSRWIRWLTEGFLLSVSAQLATLPFCFSLFGQFPTWFWLANLWAVPMSTLCLGASIAWIPFQFIPIAESWADEGLSWLIKLLCYPIERIAQWPFAILSLPPIPMLSLIGCATLALFLIFYSKGYRVPIIAFTFSITLLIAGFLLHHLQIKRMELEYLSSTRPDAFVLIRKGESVHFIYHQTIPSRDSLSIHEHLRWYPVKQLKKTWVPKVSH